MNKSSMLLEYRCHARGCLLLAVWQTPQGPEFSAPRMPRIEEAGRRMGRYTEGLETGGPLDALPWSVLLVCKHTHRDVFADVIRADAADQKPGQPKRVVFRGVDE